MAAAERLAALSPDSPPEEVAAVLSAAAAAAAEGADDAEHVALTAAVLVLPAELSAPGAGGLLCQLTAELARREAGRRQLSERRLLDRLVTELRTAAEPGRPPDQLVQPCRALGNLCYNGAPARAALLEPPGPETLTAAVCSAAQAGQQGGRAREVVSGLVLNFCNDHPAGVHWAVASGSLDRLLAACVADVSQPVLLRHTLVAAGLVAESDRQAALHGTALAPLLAESLLPHTDGGVREEALETAAVWCRHDEAKLALAQAGVADSLVRLLPTAECPAEARSLLVELLSGDQAMAALYRRGEGAVYRAVRGWLAAPAPAPEELTVCACHCLANFATNDDHALAMVRSGVHGELVSALSSDSGRLQVAALSLLRNLCLPPANKAALLEAGLLDRLLRLSVTEQPALFKYYGTLRLLTADSGAACGRLADQPGLLARLTADSDGDGPYGVQHEARRLIARIVRTAQSVEVAAAVAAAGGHSSLVRLLRAENAVMANEALLALCYTAPHTEGRQIARSELAAALTAVLTSAQLPAQVKENAVTLLVLLQSRAEPEVAEALSGVPRPAPSADR